MFKKNNHAINFDTNKDLEILNSENDKYMNSVLEELLLTHNEMKINEFDKIRNKCVTEFKKYILFQ